MTAVANCLKLVTTAMAIASLTATVTACATNSKLKDVPRLAHATTMPLQLKKMTPVSSKDVMVAFMHRP